MSDCIFCKLANGEIPTATLCENDEFRAILDAGPASKGHALVLPKAHYADLREIPDDLCAKAFVFAKHTAVRLEKAMKCDGFNIVQNNGEEAGQTVFHMHIHLIPRYKGSAPIVANWTPGTATDELKEEILAAFAAAE